MLRASATEIFLRSSNEAPNDAEILSRREQRKDRSDQDPNADARYTVREIEYWRVSGIEMSKHVVTRAVTMVAEIGV